MGESAERSSRKSEPFSFFPLQTLKKKKKTASGRRAPSAGPRGSSGNPPRHTSSSSSRSSSDDDSGSRGPSDAFSTAGDAPEAVGAGGPPRDGPLHKAALRLLLQRVRGHGGSLRRVRVRDREGEGEARYLQRGLRRCADKERRGEKRKKREERGFKLKNSKTQQQKTSRLRRRRGPRRLGRHQGRRLRLRLVRGLLGVHREGHAARLGCFVNSTCNIFEKSR